MATKIHPTIQDEQLVKDFKAYVDSIYGYNRAVFGYQIEVLMFKYLAEADYSDYRERYEAVYGLVSPVIESDTHTHKPINNADKLLIQEIYSRFGIGDEVTFSALCKIMISECGLKDSRTHKTHIKTLIALDIIEEASLNSFHKYNILKPINLEGDE